MTTTPDVGPTVVFVCVKNGGKSQMAAALARLRGGDGWDVHSAGTHPGASLNGESRASIERAGASMDGEHPKPLDPTLAARAARVVVLGEAADDVRARHPDATIEVWHLDEPSLRGIEGSQRMDLLRDEIDTRVAALARELGVDPDAHPIPDSAPARAHTVVGESDAPNPAPTHTLATHPPSVSETTRARPAGRAYPGTLS